MIHPLSFFFLFAGICSGSPGLAFADDAAAATTSPVPASARYAQLSPDERDELRGELRRRAQDWADRKSRSLSPIGLKRSSQRRLIDDADPDPGLTERERTLLREQLRRLYTEPRPAPSGSGMPIGPASEARATASLPVSSDRARLAQSGEPAAVRGERSAPALR